MSRRRRSSTRARLRILGGIVLLAPALVSCDAASGAVESTPASRPAEVRREDFRRVALLTGRLDAVVGHPVIVSRLPSWQAPIRWMVEDGTAVAEGDRVAELDSAQFLSELDDKRVALEGARGELDAKRAEIEGRIAEKEHALEKARLAHRRAELDAEVPEDIQPRRAWQEAQLALERASTALAKAEADLGALVRSSEAELRVEEIAVEKADREVGDVERALESMVLRAPRDGIVVVAENRREGRKFQVGDDAWVGLELMRIPELDRMMVEADLSDVDDGLVRPGQRATCTLDTYPGRPFGCVVRAVRPVAQEAGWRSERRAFGVILDVDTADPTVMRPGMSVRVEVEVDRLEDAAVVARRALEFRDDGSVVLREAGRAARTVRLGPCNAFDCVLLDGRAEGATPAGAGP